MATESENDMNNPIAGEPARIARRLTQGLVGGTLVIAGGSLVVAAVVAFLIWRMAFSPSKPETQALSKRPVVAVARVDREDLYNEVTIPAEFRPYMQVELHAKVSGYVEQINVDIGDEVKAGQLLVKLEVPEAKDELDRAAAAEKRAEADYHDAHLIYQRLVSVNSQHPNLVAQQDLDTAEARDHTTEAAIVAAKAEVEKCQTLLDYTRITAPFDGVITRRYADPGALIQAGTTGEAQSRSLVCLSDNYRLRLDFPVSVNNVKDVKVGDSVEVRVESLGGKTFTGKISRFAGQVDEDTRTMITEIEVANPKLVIVPGMYAKVVLKVGRQPQALSIPTEAVPTGKTSTVMVVNSNQEVEERPITLGLETAAKYQVTAGLNEGDLVVIGSHPEIRSGEKVEVKLIGPLALDAHTLRGVAKNSE